MSRRSLQSRLLLASLLVLPLLLALIALMLHQAFARSLQGAEREQLQSNIYLLLSEADWQGGRLWMPDSSNEPRLSQPQSGLYAWIWRDQELLWQSPSARLRPPPLAPAAPFQVDQWQFAQPRQGKTAFFALSYDLIWETGRRSQPLRFLVWHSADRYEAELEGYRGVLLGWLGALVLLLLLAQGLILRVGLRPLRQLAQDLRALEAGDCQRLAGDYPQELMPLTQNLNLVLAAQQAQRERYRNSLADLAHSLKTPLAILQAELEQHPQPGPLRDQIGRMDQIIRHQLQRASLGVQPLHRPQVVLRPLLERLSQALAKVYRDQGLQFSLAVPPELALLAEEGDLLELLGNLLDNACKYGRGQVRVSGGQSGDELWIAIEDDGPGIPASLRQQVLARGARADTATPGQGIGLAVAVEILSSYGASLRLERSAELGGARIELSFPNSLA